MNRRHHIPERSRPRRPLIVLVLTGAAAVLITACSNPAESTGNSATTSVSTSATTTSATIAAPTTTLSPTPTTSTSTTVASDTNGPAPTGRPAFQTPEDEIGWVVAEFYDAYFESAASGELTQERLDAVALPPIIESVRRLFDQVTDGGQRLVLDATSSYDVRITQLSANSDGGAARNLEDEDSAATASVCVVDSTRLVAADGTVVDDGTRTLSDGLELESRDGIWIIVAFAALQEWEGVAGCALAS